MSAFTSVQFSPDGKDYITDYDCDSAEEVWENVNDQGSRWIFYPLPVVVNKQGGKRRRIISACDGFDMLEGRTIQQAQAWISDNPEYVEMILS